MRRTALQKLRVGDRVRVVIRYPGPGRMIEVSTEVGRVCGFIQANEEVVGLPTRSSTAGIIEREDGNPLVFVPGRDLLEGVL